MNQEIQKRGRYFHSKRAKRRRYADYTRYTEALDANPTLSRRAAAESVNLTYERVRRLCHEFENLEPISQVILNAIIKIAQEDTTDTERRERITKLIAIAIENEKENTDDR